MPPAREDPKGFHTIRRNTPVVGYRAVWAVPSAIGRPFVLKPNVLHVIRFGPESKEALS